MGLVESEFLFISLLEVGEPGIMDGEAVGIIEQEGEKQAVFSFAD